MIGCDVSPKCAVACLPGELSQQPMSADLAHAQMHPPATALQALLALCNLPRESGHPDLAEMRTAHGVGMASGRGAPESPLSSEGREGGVALARQIDEAATPAPNG